MLSHFHSCTALGHYRPNIVATTMVLFAFCFSECYVICEQISSCLGMTNLRTKKVFLNAILLLHSSKCAFCSFVFSIVLTTGDLENPRYRMVFNKDCIPKLQGHTKIKVNRYYLCHVIYA